jgi:hypothetical protein
MEGLKQIVQPKQKDKTKLNDLTEKNDDIEPKKK